ncbi:MAG: hypothetical protein IJP68_12310, partial [Selenomonadaceae bacterium]|nr:hypothetical protein [Selenomonadaceae bacterium]
MAESVGALYLRLGLNLSDLETGFVTASQTVAANISRLNRESQLIRIRSQVEIEGLDETADAERIAQIRTDALNQQLAIQRDRVRILSSELQSTTAAHGANSVAVQRATIRFERERLTLAQLESELRNLSDTSSNVADSVNNSSSVFEDLSSFLPEIPTRLEAIGIAAGAMATGIGFATESVNEMIEDFRELQKQSYELNMSFNDTEQFLRELKLAGVDDIGDLEGYIRGMTDAYVKGEVDDPEFIALSKYGAKITDATGRLKSFKDIVEEVYQAWLKADAAGEGIEFLQLTGGESGIRDAIQYFQRLKEAREDAAKIYDANLDSDELHELDRALNLTAEQSKELKNALGNIFTPAVTAGAKSFFEVLHDGTEFLAENKEAIQKWGQVAVTVFEELAPKIKNLFPSEQLQTAIDSFKEIYSDISNTELDLGTDKANAQLAKLQTDAEQFYSEGLTTKAYKKFFGDLSTTDFFKDNPIIKAIREADAAQEELSAEIAVSKENAEQLADVFSRGAKLVQDAASGDVLSQYGLQRIKEFKDELEELRIEIDFDDNDYEKAKAQLDLWRQRELTDKLYVSADERAAIEELYAAKSEQIEQERADKLAEIRESIASADKTALEQKLDSIEKEKQAWLQAGMEESEAVELAQKKIAAAYQEAAQKAQEHWRNAADIQFSMTHTAFEKELRDIELWKDAQREKADTAEEISGIIAESAAKEADAFEREVDRIKGKVQSLEDKIFAQEHSRYENDLRKLAQERYQLYQEGIYSPVMIERYYQNALSKLKSQVAQGGDYTKSPISDGKQRGGNGIVVIGGDQIIDDGLIKSRQEKIGLLADENKIRAQLLAGMSESERQLVAAQLAMRNFSNVQMPQPQVQKPSGFQVIEGDKVIEMPESTAYLQEFNSALQQTTSGIEQFTPPTQEISAEPLQEFNAVLERVSSEIERLNPFEPIANAGNFLAERLNQAAQDFPTEYFQNLADGAKSVSTMQLSLTDSTMKLIDAQENLRNALKSLLSDKAQMETKLPTDGFRQLSTSTQDFMTMQQDLLNRRTRELEQLPASQPRNKGLNFGFDMDTAGAVLGLGALIAGIGGAPITAPIAAGITALSALGGLAKGTYDNTSEMPNARTFENVDLTQLSTPLTSLDGNVQ